MANLSTFTSNCSALKVDCFDSGNRWQKKAVEKTAKAVKKTAVPMLPLLKQVWLTVLWSVDFFSGGANWWTNPCVGHWCTLDLHEFMDLPSLMSSVSCVMSTMCISGVSGVSLLGRNIHRHVGEQLSAEF